MKGFRTLGTVGVFQSIYPSLLLSSSSSSSLLSSRTSLAAFVSPIHRLSNTGEIRRTTTTTTTTMMNQMSDKDLEMDGRMDEEEVKTTTTSISNVLPPLPEGSRRIYIIRHGETEWNKLGKIQGGGYDIPLNENGRQQAWTTAMAFHDIPLGVIASSHLSRAKETADILLLQQQQQQDDSTTTTIPSPPPSVQRIVLEGFGEMRFGEFEGLARHDPSNTNPDIPSLDLSERFRMISKELKEDIDKAFPGEGGESTRDVEIRAMAALEEILTEFSNERHIAIVAHGRTNKVLIASTGLGDVKLFSTVKQGNTAINVMDIDADGKWTVQIINYLEHVKGNVIIR